MHVMTKANKASAGTKQARMPDRGRETVGRGERTETAGRSATDQDGKEEEWQLEQ